MLNKLNLLIQISFVFLILSSSKINAQTFCTNSNGTFLIAITNSWNTVVVTGGYYEFNATAGCDYTFSYCSNGGSSGNDPYLTISDVFDNAFDWNDDFCGLGSELTWTCPSTNTYRIHLGQCCGGTSVCSFPAATLAYYSSCSACPGTPPVAPLVTGDSNCGPGTLTLTADQNGATNCMTIWYQQGNNSPIDTTYTSISNLVVTLNSTSNYYVTNLDTLSGCYSSYSLIIAAINPFPSLFVNGLNNSICIDNGSITPSLQPTGGTLSGPGFSSNIFNPLTAGVGTHEFYYDYTNPSTGCQNIDTFNVVVVDPTVDPIIFICDGSIVTLTGTGFSTYEWYDLQTGGNNIGSGASINVFNITGDSTFFYSEALTSDGFKIDTLLSTNSSFVDHNSITGDDHGGMAITQNYIYYVGDNSSVRYDFPSLTNPISLPIRDGIFSDLSNGTLWSLWDGLSDPSGTSISTGGYTISSLIELNTDLTFGANILNLSQPIITGGNYGGPQSGIFAGQGFMIFHNNDDDNFYHIDLLSGTVTILSNISFPSNAGSTENWARWGVAEYYNGEYSVVYSTSYYDNSIDRIYCVSGTTEIVAQFTNLGDVASIVYSPWAYKWAFHSESDTDFSPYGEMIVQLDGNHLISTSNNLCRKEVTVSVGPLVSNAGADVVILPGNSTTLIGSGGNFASWSPTTGLNNPTSFTPTASPTVTTMYYLTVSDGNGCEDIDSVLVTVSNVGLNENTLQNNINVYPNPSIGDVTIDLSGFKDFASAKLNVVDIYGKLIISLEGSENKQIVLKKESLSSGIYTLNIMIDGQTYSNRLILID